MTLLVMAAGLGSRFAGGIKQITPIDDNNNLIIDYSVFDAVRAGFDHVVFIINRNIEKDFRERIFDRIKDKVNAEYVIQDIDDLPGDFKTPKGRTKPWGTVQAILAARDKIDKPFCVINADDFYGAEAFQTVAQFLKRDKTRNALVGYDPENTVPREGLCNRGLCKVDKNGMMLGCTELYNVHRKGGKIGYMDDKEFVVVNPGSYFSMNMFVFRPNIMKLLEDRFAHWLADKVDVEKSEYIIADAVNELLHSGDIQMELLQTDSQWFGLTYKDDVVLVRERIKSLVLAGVYPINLWADPGVSKDMTLLIMAAGMGARYGGIKQIDPIGHHGELIIDYSVFDAIQAGFTKVVFVIRREIEKDFRTTFFNRIRKHIKCEYVFQETPGWRSAKPLGTTAAVLAAKDVIDGPFCVINADDFYGATAFKKVADFFAGEYDESTCVTVAYDLSNTISEFGTVSRGTLSVQDGFVTDIKEHICIKRGKEYDFMVNGAYVPTTANLKVSMNFFGLTPAVIRHLDNMFTRFLLELDTDCTEDKLKRECFLSENIGQLVKDGKITLRALSTKDKWVGFTYPDDKQYVQGAIQGLVAQGVYPSPLWQA